MRPRLPIGTSDFIQLRRDRPHYVDKSGFVAEVMHSTARVLLLPRPRRFGKTLNLWTLAAFLECTDEDRSELFSDLAASLAGDDVRGHFGRYPVVSLTLKAAAAASCRREVTRREAHSVAAASAPAKSRGAEGLRPPSKAAGG